MGKLWKEEKESATKQRREHTYLGDGDGGQLCFSLGFDDDRRGILRSADVSLTMYIISISGSKSLTSFTNCFFLFRRPLGLRLAFDAVERNEKSGCIQCQRSKESSSRGKERDEYSSVEGSES